MQPFDVIDWKIADKLKLGLQLVPCRVKWRWSPGFSLSLLHGENPS